MLYIKCYILAVTLLPMFKIYDFFFFDLNYSSLFKVIILL